MPDVDGFDEFYRGSRQRLLGFVYVLTGDLAEAQDAVQEAYIRAWQRWSTVSGYDDPEAWVRVVASRIAVSRWRSLRSRARAYLRHGATETVPGPEHRHGRRGGRAAPAARGAAHRHRALLPARHAGRRGGPGDRGPGGHRQGPALPGAHRARRAARRRWIWRRPDA